ncbi:MAG TPA: ABC transporter ATP-binding protein [Minicystis sp.]|nr:ABC transporter ATP-binding protein [Minicystis sp.]
MNAVEVLELVKRFGELTAVDGISLAVAPGEIFGFLGPNGAGKSTTIKILSTLLAPTSGAARIDGPDVVREPAAVRRALALVFQDPSLDDRLTARENLRLHCVMYDVPRAERAPRVDDALATMDLVAVGDARVRTFSGGMRRRLEIARALLHRPRVLFLDEPTTGLDPQTRRSLWQRLRALRDETGLTIFMSTHYMDEAEHCDRVAIIDHGRVVAQGTPEALRRGAGSDRVRVATDDDARAAAELALRGYAPRVVDGALELEVESGEAFLPRLVDFPVRLRDLSIRKPTLEDAFIAMTGRAIRDDGADARDALRADVRARRRT